MINIKYFYICDKGNSNINNQDSVLVPKINRVVPITETPTFAIFDGCGGKIFGKDASMLSSEYFNELLNNNETLSEMCIQVNRRLYNEMTIHNYSKMGSTIEVIRFSAQEIEFCNIGNSSIFLFRNNKLFKISKEHSFIINKKKIITQYLGMSEKEYKIEPWVHNEKIQLHDVYLLCSDGLTNYVSENQITSILLSKFSIEKKSFLLYKTAMNNGNRDNISIILCQIVNNMSNILFFNKE